MRQDENHQRYPVECLLIVSSMLTKTTFWTAKTKKMKGRNGKGRRRNVIVYLGTKELFISYQKRRPSFYHRDGPLLFLLLI